MSTETAVAATTWLIDPAHTLVEFEVKHMMFSRVRGRFEAVSGSLDVGSPADPEAWSAKAVIDASSIRTGNGQRDAHLRSADFFEVDRFPKLRFESRSVRRAPDGGLVVGGHLTIRDITRDVELDVVEAGRGTDPEGNERIAFSATTSLDRHDFGLTWNQALEAGGVLVGREVKITLEVQATAGTEG